MDDASALINAKASKDWKNISGFSAVPCQ